PRPRQAGDTIRTRLPCAGQRGAGEEQGGVRDDIAASTNVILRSALRARLEGWATYTGSHPSRLVEDGEHLRMTELPVLVRRLPLLDECRHAFGAVLQREGRVKQVAFDVESFGQRRLECAVDGALGHFGR